MSLDYEAGFRAGKQDAQKAMERRIAEAVIEERNRCLSACESLFMDEPPANPLDAAYQLALEECVAAIMEGTLNV